MQLFVAAKAIIMNELGQVLILKEQVSEEGTNATKWGVPGGRLKQDEEFFDGLHREVKEETNLMIIPGHPVMVGEWHPVVKGLSRQIIAMYIACKTSAKPTMVAVSEEHDDFAWITAEEIDRYDFMPPDDDAVRRFFSNSASFFNGDIR